ncbi:MAG: O-antigen ligase family protein [Actinomycetota bacterium]
MSYKLSPTLPRAAAVAAAGFAIVLFVSAMLLPAVLPQRVPPELWPVLALLALWLVPFGLALIEGKRWAYVLAMALILFLTDAIFRTRDWADKSFDWQVLLKGLTWLGCGAAGALRLGRTGRLLARPPMVFVAGFVAMLALSVSWSPGPGFAFLSAMAYICFLLFALAAADVLDDDGLLAGLALGTGLIVLPSLAISPFDTGIAPTSPGATGETDRLRGLTDHPIPLAEACAAFVFATLAIMVRSRRWTVKAAMAALAVAGLVTLALTQSRLPGLAMAAAVLAWWAYRRGGLLLMLPSLAGLLILVLGAESLAGLSRVLPSDILEDFARSGSAHEILTLSGRLYIWPYVLERIQEAPWFGHGHAAGMILFNGFTAWRITHAHNGFLQSLLYVGIVGTTFLVAALAWQIAAFLARPSMVRDVFMLNALILCITEQSMVANMPSRTALLWMIAAAMASQPYTRPKRLETTSASRTCS